MGGALVALVGRENLESQAWRRPISSELKRDAIG